MRECVPRVVLDIKFRNLPRFFEEWSVRLGPGWLGGLLDEGVKKSLQRSRNPFLSLLDTCFLAMSTGASDEGVAAPVPPHQCPTLITHCSVCCAVFGSFPFICQEQVRIPKRLY